MSQQHKEDEKKPTNDSIGLIPSDKPLSHFGRIPNFKKIESMRADLNMLTTAIEARVCAIEARVCAGRGDKVNPAVKILWTQIQTCGDEALKEHFKRKYKELPIEYTLKNIESRIRNLIMMRYSQ